MTAALSSFMLPARCRQYPVRFSHVVASKYSADAETPARLIADASDDNQPRVHRGGAFATIIGSGKQPILSFMETHA
jgi:hypothetical protein